MLKYVDTKEVFAEIPDEITLAISISGYQYQWLPHSLQRLS